MAGTIQISKDTIVKLLIRRGTDIERKLTTLTEGELGYTIDTQRVFIGDGITLGGVPAGNKFLGTIASKSVYTSQAQTGDTIYQTGGGSEGDTMFAYDAGLGWIDIHPKPYAYNLEKSNLGQWRVSSLFVGGDKDELVPSGLTVTYDDTNKENQSLTNINNRLDFDCRYMSLCADTATPYLSSSFYFGNIRRKSVNNTRSATVNIDQSLFINGRNSTKQIQVFGVDPADANSSALRNYYGGFNVGGYNNLTLQVNQQTGYKLSYSGTTLNTTFSSRQDGTFGSPNFTFKGVTKFDNPVFFEAAADVTINGNLSVYGDISYFETTVSTTSALSVINNNPNTVALYVAQLNTDPSYPDQTIARFKSGESSKSILNVKEQDFVGINVVDTDTYDTYNSHFAVSGNAIFSRHPGYSNSTFKVYHKDIDILGSGNVVIGARTTGNLYLSSGALGYVTVYGGINAFGGDVIAFFTSDKKYKDNIQTIESPLEKVNKLSGINFTWTDDSPYSGEDIGVLAQEVEKVIPSAVTTRPNGTKAVRYEKIIPLLIEAIKELNTKK